MADATASKKSSNHLKIEDAGPARKRLTITIPPEVIKQKITESMQTLSAETTLPGFRKGHVPNQLLERRFGSALRNETKNQIIADAYASAIEELELKPIGEPEPADSLDELELVDDKPLEFSIEVEVVPDIELPSLEDLEIMRPNLDIEELHIDRELKRLRSELGETSEIKDNIQPEDRLFGHAIVTKKGDEEPVLDQNKVLIIYPTDEEDGRGPVLGLMIDKLADSLKGKSVGDTITLKTTGPDSHEREDLRGADLTIMYEVTEVHRIEPATSAEVVEKYGMASEEILKEQIRFALEQRREEEQANVMREQACEQLASKVEFDLPQSLTTEQSQRQLERIRMQLQFQGVPTDEIEARVAEARGESESHARSKLKMFFLLQRLAEHYKIEVSEQEINSRIAMMAAQRGVRPDRLKTELVQANRVTELAAQIRESKAADQLVAQSTVTDVSIDEWNDYLAAQAGGGTKTSTTKKKGSKKTKNTASQDTSVTKKSTGTKKKKKGASVK